MGLKVKSLDVSEYEGADFIHDLNSPDPPEELTCKFDLIFNGGTMEHIPNVLRNIYTMLKVGGFIIHASPSNNCVDHGFYQFSHTFFMDYYSSNNFEILDCKFIQFTRNHNAPYMFMEYWPGRLDHLSFGGIDDGKIYATWFVAKKKQDSQCSVIPQQGVYVKTKGWIK